ncbi:MAG: hypothetical protein US18_C0022G0004 [Parcubacteria group bacterium GW2011_GWB1_36_5]|uniref:Uncharacterized protein n=1 Tax=Candidatus Curtissbacteria bacterium GW2011_GWC2_38_9 TaxID=1618414 RepID=A0A0G0LBG6_9BACT|nr:MAG: hypothetical protein US18_C0022G0004 [Parcubacteria group bacterium GW2011_GWB1_36_5]KKQ89373.1 MAG: hypothetical protein UT12_C0015G0004 [Candidatus Curtissbacteria bacterium GW2011_GWC2_38_9]
MFQIKNGDTYSLNDVHKHQIEGGSILRSAHAGNFDPTTLLLAQEKFPIILHEHIRGTSKIYEPSFVKINNIKIPIAQDIRLPLTHLSLLDNKKYIGRFKKLIGEFKNPAQAHFLSLKKIFPNNVQLASQFLIGQDPFFEKALKILANSFPHHFVNYVRRDGEIFYLTEGEQLSTQRYVSKSGEEILIEKGALAELTHTYCLKTIDVIVSGAPANIEGIVMDTNLYILLCSVCEIYKHRNGIERFDANEVTLLHFSGVEMINYLVLNQKLAKQNSQEINRMYKLLLEYMNSVLPKKSILF